MTEHPVRAEPTYTTLRELIVSGEYAPGRRITELELSERLAVSRTPVREALRVLAGDGLVRPEKRGVAVVALDEKAVREAYWVRANLEALTAELTALRQHEGELSPAALHRLRTQAERTDELTRRGDLAAAVEQNRAFHRMIAELADNAIALGMLDRIWDQIVVSTRESLHGQRHGERTEQVDEEHRQLIEAIAEGKPDEAARLARAHVLTTLATNNAEARQGTEGTH